MAKEVFQLEVQVQTNPALTGLNQIDRKLKDVKSSADKIGTGASGLNLLGASARNATTAFSGLGAALSGLALGSVATEVVKSIAAMQSLQVVLETVAGGVTQAADAMTLLKQVAATTPFSVDQLGQSFIKLKAAGLEPTGEQLRLFSDIASVTTDKVGSLQAITDLYARTTAGGLGLEELNRLADRGIPVFDILGKRLGASRLQLSELGKTAEGAQIILRNLEAGLGAQFGGASARSLTTLNGQFDTLIKNLKALATSAGGTSTSGLTKGLTDLLTVINQVITGSNAISKALGETFGTALSGLGKVILFVKNNIIDLTFLLAGAFLMFSPLGRVITTTTTSVTGLAKALGLLYLKYPKLTSLLGLGTFLQIIGYETDKIADKSKKLSETGAGAGRGNGAAQLADYNARATDDRARAKELLTGQEQILSKIINSIKQETALIGLSKQASEEQNAILSAQAQIRDKLMAGGTMTESQADAEAALQVAKRAGEIRSAIATKYQTESRVFFAEMVKAGNTEISQLTMSNNERERANQLKEIQVNLGMTDAMWSKEKSKYEAEIARTQAARVNDSLNKSLEGINKETEYLKLSNKEREIRIALDQAAADAGLKNAKDLGAQRTAQITDAVKNRQQATVDVAGAEQIKQMEEELGLLKMLDTRTREYTKTRNDLYKAIDPEGRGTNISNAQKDAIQNLILQTEQAQALLDINKKIEDSYASLGSAVSNWAMGGENAIKQVRLELVKLLAMQAFKTFAGGMPTGATGSFISGVIGGLSGARENGGPVSAGKSYLVGEKRPEVFVPQTNGYIVPNVAMMSTRTGATNVTLSPNLIIQGSVTGQTELENMFDQFASAMAQETQQFVINQRGQNGILAR